MTRGQDDRFYGLLVEFDDAHNLVDACARVRDAGFERLSRLRPPPSNRVEDPVGRSMAHGERRRCAHAGVASGLP